jgi:hypothetical protein
MVNALRLSYKIAVKSAGNNALMLGLLAMQANEVLAVDCQNGASEGG